jgi:hypothetical protein
MMHDVMPPVLVFVATAGLAGIGAEVMSIARTASATQGAVFVRAAHDHQHDQRDFEGR